MPEVNTTKKKRSPRKKFLYLGIALVASLAIAGGAYLLIAHLQKNAIELEYGDYSITKERYDELIAEAHELVISTEDAREALIASLKAQAAAKEVGVKEENYKPQAAAMALETAGRMIKDVDEESYHQRVKYPEAIETELGFLEEGGYKFASFLFPFTKRIYNAEMAQVGIENEDGQTEPPTVEEIREDVAYAKERAEMYREKLVSGEMRVDQIIDEIHEDTRLVHGGAANTSGVRTVPLQGKLQRGDGMVVDYGDIGSILDELEVGTISEVYETLGTGYTQEYPEELNTEDGVIAGYEFSYYMEKTEPHGDIKQRYREAVERL